MTQADKLREAAAAATPGKWIYNMGDDEPVVCLDVFDRMTGVQAIVAEVEFGVDAAFIALANPQAVTELLDERDALRARVEGLESALEPFAYIAEMDIGEDENDFDFYQVAIRSNARPTVGMFRRARDTMEAGDEIDPDAIDWRDGETRRMVGGTLVYRSYEDYCYD